MVVQAQTGSGKTLSYLLPLFEKIDTTKRETQVIVLAPTHELVMQIVNQVKLLSQNSEIPVTTLPLIGEVNIQKQIKNIKDTKPHIVVGSCGRILDLIKQRKQHEPLPTSALETSFMLEKVLSSAIAEIKEPYNKAIAALEDKINDKNEIIADLREQVAELLKDKASLQTTIETLQQRDGLENFIFPPGVADKKDQDTSHV